ncbi:unnamed protein product, partial [Meganyctiphanes norvegica]
MEWLSTLFPDKNSRLCTAVSKGDYKGVESALLDGANPNMSMPLDHIQRKYQGATMLTVAVERGDANVVTTLLKAKAKTEERGNRVKAPLAMAIELGNNNIAVKLLDCGADVHSRELVIGTLPIHNAALKGFVKIAKILQAYGSDLYAVDYSGQTSLHYAAMRGNKAMAEWLVKNGIYVAAVRDDGYCAAAYAESHGYNDLARWLYSCKVDPGDAVAKLWIQEHKIAAKNMSSLEIENAKLSSSIETLQQQLQIITKNIIDKENENSQLTSQVKETSSQMKNLQRQLQNAEKCNRDLEIENIQLKLQVEKTSRQNKVLQQQIM